MLKRLVLIMFIAITIIPNVHAEEYVIKKGDVISVSVWGEDDLDLELKVNQKGMISFPLIGRVEVAGSTLQEADDKITELLAKDYFVNPDVTVEMAIVQFFVTGEVKNPGAYPLLGNITPLQAITMAGGFTDFASHTVQIVRKVDEKTRTIKVNVDSFAHTFSALKDDYMIKPDDVIVVKRSFF